MSERDDLKRAVEQSGAKWDEGHFYYRHGMCRCRMCVAILAYVAGRESVTSTVQPALPEQEGT